MTETKPAATMSALAASARSLFPVFSLVIATFLAYWPAWFGQPVWDDDGHITRLELRSLDGLAQIWTQVGATQQYYPLAFTAFWVQCRLWGETTLGYHLVNIALHCLCALLFLRILRRLEVPGAFLAAAIFALHPVHVESVAWITELKNTLSGAFFLGSALAYLGFDQTRGKGRYALAFGLFVLGLLTKTAIATMPAGMLVVLWWKRGRLSWKGDVLPTLPFFLAGLTAGLVTVWAEQKVFGATGPEFHLSVIERGLVAGRSLWFHLGKLLWPAGLIFMYPRWQVNQAVWWQYLWPLAAALVTAGLWVLARWNRGPLAALLFFAGTLFPALGFFNAYSFRYSFVNDHHQYLASMAIIALASAVVARLLARWGLWGKVSGNGLCGVLLALLATLTWQHAGAFRDMASLWRDTLAKNPACWMAHYNLGTLLSQRGQADEAIRQLQEAIRLKPDHAKAHYNLGVVLDQRGQLDEAIRQFQEALRLKPGDAAAYSNLGAALGKKGQIDEAIRQFQTGLRLKPDYAEIHNNLGTALAMQGQVDEAIHHFQEALRLKPDSATTRSNLDIMLAAKAASLQTPGATTNR